jgi:mRNA interferase RelE/StbE
VTLTIVWTARGERDRERIEPAMRARIIAAVERLAATGRGDVKRLRGSADPEYRLRVGDWRLRFVIDHERGVLRVRRVLPRSEAYR